MRRVLITRIQRSRERGSQQPVNTKYCGRPTEWGNPFPIGEEYTRAQALEAFRAAFWAYEMPVTPARARTELAAYDYLSCWCRLEQPCHVDEYIRAISCEHRLRDADGRFCLVCKIMSAQGHRHREATGYLPGLRQNLRRMVNAVNVS